MEAMELLGASDPLSGLDSEFGSLGAGDVASPVAKQEGMMSSIEQYLSPVADEGAGSSFIGKALEKVMPAIFNAAARPQRQMQAPLGGSGHGVSASTSSLSEPFKEINQMTSANPLGDLSEWEHLF